MTLESLLFDQQDLEAVDELIEVIQSPKKAVFIGAGVSKKSMYRDWDEVIHGTIDKPGLKSLLDNDIEAQKCSGPSEIAEKCFQKNLEGYLNFMKAEFGEDNFTENEIIDKLVKIEFDHYVTTNFDKCLFSNVKNGRLNSYPTLHDDFTNIPGVTYLHGRAFKLREETDDEFNVCLQSLVFRENIYIEAYDKDGSGSGICHHYLYNLCKDFNIVFLGFSFSDHYVLDSLIQIMNQFAYQDKNIKRYNENFPINRKKIYIFRDKDDLSSRDHELMKFVNIKYIKYFKLDNNHRGLSQLLHEIFILSNLNNFQTRIF